MTRKLPLTRREAVALRLILRMPRPDKYPTIPGLPPCPEHGVPAVALIRAMADHFKEDYRLTRTSFHGMASRMIIRGLISSQRGVPGRANGVAYEVTDVGRAYLQGYMRDLREHLAEIEDGVLA